MTPSTALVGRRVMVVEDEPLIAMLLEDMLVELQMEPAAAADSVPAALEALRSVQGLDAAILDMNLRGRSVEPVAVALTDLGVPFIFASGYGADSLTNRFAGVPVLSKPFRKEALEAALTLALERATATGSA